MMQASFEQADCLHFHRLLQPPASTRTQQNKAKRLRDQAA